MPDSWKPRTGQKIEALFAWVATEPDGGEGVCGADIGLGGVTPLIGADRERIESYRDAALIRATRKISNEPKTGDGTCRDLTGIRFGRPARNGYFSTATAPAGWSRP